MQIFRRKRVKMNPRMFIICDSKDDLKDLWMWCYEHNYNTNGELFKWLNNYDDYNKNEYGDFLSDPPMYYIENDEGLVAYYASKDSTGNSLEDYEYCREHAIHAKDIDFDFLRDILNRR